MPSTAEEWIDFARGRLSPERTHLTLTDAPPVEAPGDLGAVAGFGGEAEGVDLHVSVYVFEEWGAGLAPMQDLKAHAEAQGREPLAVVDGPVLFFATAGPEQEDRLALFAVADCFSGPRL
ncbi:MAG TPA: hypothetical protein VFJ85_19995 [Acidimicrobiales bacterium]|nr:hypothetical protein [Acidimicrobiales bacterium]